MYALHLLQRCTECVAAVRFIFDVDRPNISGFDLPLRHDVFQDGNVMFDLMRDVKRRDDLIHWNTRNRQVTTLSPPRGARTTHLPCKLVPRVVVLCLQMRQLLHNIPMHTAMALHHLLHICR